MSEAPASLRIEIVQTAYPHWSRYSGYHQYVSHLSDRIAAHLTRVPRDACDSFLDRLLRIPGRIWTRRAGSLWYDYPDLRTEWKLYREHRKRPCDLVHFLDGEHGYGHLGKWRSGRRPRLAATFHQPPRVLESILVRPERLALLDHVILVGSGQRPFFERFVAPEKLSVIPHGVHTEFFSPPQDRPFAVGELVCLAVGTNYRDYRLLLRAAARLRDRPSIRFRIVARAPEGMEEAPNVRWTSGLSDGELLAAYRQADILAMPLTDSTANNVILEAMAAGLPVVTTAVGSVRDYVRSDFAETVAPGDAEALADAIARLAEDPRQRRVMGELARRAAVEAFGLTRTAGKMESLYRELCAAE